MMPGCEFIFSILDLSVDIQVEYWYTKLCIHWGVAKSVRHGTLTPACVGSSPAAPAIFITN